MMRRKTRSRLFLLFLAVGFATITIYILKSGPSIPSAPRPPFVHSPNPPATDPPGSSLHESLPSPSSGSHPIWTLISNAGRDFEVIKARQSKTLPEAVAEYRRRYGMHPPPNFDKWYDFAKKRDVQLIDEYDTIHQSLTPFWALKPATIRARAREALGYDNNLIGVLIRNGNITRQEGGREWMQKAIDGMTAQFREFLPDLDLCFNVYDEPRVILPHDDLARLVAKAKNTAIPAANAIEKPRNEWSWRPGDLNDGIRINEVGETRFNSIEHQATWAQSRISCPPDSAARSLEEYQASKDDVEKYELGPLGFIYNQTAFSDVCNSPSFGSSFGLFSGPNSFNVVHDLFPIFSQSKVSSFQDIVYPSPWYWYDKVPYEEKKDIPWMEKANQMYWRGSTTGGFSRYGGWRRQHRQRFVMKVNAQEPATILANKGDDESKPNWIVKSIWRPDFKDIFNIKFTHIGQCERGDCAAQTEFFDVVSQTKAVEAYKWKYLLDIDGNAFSGRFYAFLKSKSLVYKLAVFREWHAEVVKPWVHYIPLSLKGEEWIESVRWFAGGSDGKREAERIAQASSEWAGKALRNEDIEAWFFRLLLEYSRLVDDNREVIGYAP